MVKTGPGLWKDFTTSLNIFLCWNLTNFYPNPSPQILPFFDNDEIQNLTLRLLWQIFFSPSLKRNKIEREMNFEEMM